MAGKPGFRSSEACSVKSATGLPVGIYEDRQPSCLCVGKKCSRRIQKDKTPVTNIDEIICFSEIMLEKGRIYAVNSEIDAMTSRRMIIRNVPIPIWRKFGYIFSPFVSSPKFHGVAKVHHEERPRVLGIFQQSNAGK